jgi:hypothetical protein
LTEGVTIGQTLGAQTGGTAIDDEQRAFTSPFTQAQRQELVCCAAAKVRNENRSITAMMRFTMQHLPDADFAPHG